MDYIEIYEYCSLLEKWYKETYDVEYDAYVTEPNYMEKFEMCMGFRFEETTVDTKYVRLDIIDENKVFLNKIKYGFSTFSGKSSCLV